MRKEILGTLGFAPEMFSRNLCGKYVFSAYAVFPVFLKEKYLAANLQRFFSEKNERWRQEKKFWLMTQCLPKAITSSSFFIAYNDF